VDVDDLESERMRSLLYVAASRARTLLCSIRHKETTSTFARRVADLALTRTKSENSVIEIL
jgi:ATP-dependent exoDNAse (exonuclease V) alpha subunit